MWTRDETQLSVLALGHHFRDVQRRETDAGGFTVRMPHEHVKQRTRPDVAVVGMWNLVTLSAIQNDAEWRERNRAQMFSNLFQHGGYLRFEMDARKEFFLRRTMTSDMQQPTPQCVA